MQVTQFRELVTVTVLFAGVGLLVMNRELGLAFLPLVVLTLRYWFGGKNGQREACGAQTPAGGGDEAAAEG